MGIRTGAQYLAGLRDDRQIFVNGDLISDVTDYPAFRRGAKELARVYDYQHDPAEKSPLADSNIPVANDRWACCKARPPNYFPQRRFKPKMPANSRDNTYKSAVRSMAMSIKSTKVIRTTLPPYPITTKPGSSEMKYPAMTARETAKSAIPNSRISLAQTDVGSICRSTR